MKKLTLIIIDLPIRFILALITCIFTGWIGWLGIVLVALKYFGVAIGPWWAFALPFEYLTLYCLYMVIDGLLYRAGLKDIGRYARFTTPDEVLEFAKENQSTEATLREVKAELNEEGLNQEDRNLLTMYKQVLEQANLPG